jgi:hypothetical protein
MPVISRQVIDAVTASRGQEARNIAKVAAGRELLCDVFNAMRDGRVRRAPTPGQTARAAPGPKAGREAAHPSAPPAATPVPAARATS